MSFGSPYAITEQEFLPALKMDPAGQAHFYFFVRERRLAAWRLASEGQQTAFWTTFTKIENVPSAKIVAESLDTQIASTYMEET
jgi:hypothetical protein